MFKFRQWHECHISDTLTFAILSSIVYIKNKWTPLHVTSQTQTAPKCEVKVRPLIGWVTWARVHYWNQCWPKNKAPGRKKIGNWSACWNLKCARVHFSKYLFSYFGSNSHCMHWSTFVYKVLIAGMASSEHFIFQPEFHHNCAFCALLSLVPAAKGVYFSQTLTCCFCIIWRDPNGYLTQL